MNDQAASLRKLKQLVDKTKISNENPEEFLQEIIRPTPFTSIALIWPDQLFSSFPDITNWISSLMQLSPRAHYWDQAGMIDSKSLPKTQVRLKYPTPVRLESQMTPLTVIPHQPTLIELFKKSDGIKIDFLRHIIRSLKPASEMWVSLKASELKKYHSLLHSTDAVCIMVPDNPDSILQCYEIVKSIHLSGYFSPVGLLDFKCETPSESELHSIRIKNVAKQFLALDLVPSGVVLSNSRIVEPDSSISFRSRLQSVDSICKDFLFCLCENIIYPIPGLE